MMNKILIICVDFFEFNVKKKWVGIKVINIGNLQYYFLKMYIYCRGILKLIFIKLKLLKKWFIYL